MFYGLAFGFLFWVAVYFWSVSKAPRGCSIDYRDAAVKLFIYAGCGAALGFLGGSFL